MIRHIGVQFNLESLIFYGTTSKFNIQILKYRIHVFKIVIRSLGWFIYENQ